MKKKYIIAALSTLVVVVVVLVAINPFGWGISVSNGNGNGNRPPDTENWISPGKFYIEEYVPGEAVECQLEIHNGNSTARMFSVGYRVPDFVTNNFSRPTSEVYEWIWISDKRLEVSGLGTETVTIRLGMPSSATPPGSKWEFWIGVIDLGQEGIVQVELATRILVTMR